jgi:membrane-bound ClpP family serine protease
MAVYDRSVGRLVCAGVVLIVIGLILVVFADAFVTGAVLIVLGIAAIVYGWRREPPEQLVELRATIQNTECRLATAKAVVEN